ncbi:radical SAM protein, partial [Desulfobacteraceae bacterium SEEP-SAG9]
LVMAGGVACFSNPEAISRFVDCFLIGEAEAILPRFFDAFDPHADRKACLKTLAGSIPGIYVPEFYHAIYDSEGYFQGLEPVDDVPAKIERVFVKDLSQISTCSTILTPHTTFDSTFLIEVARGCPHGCRFCSAGFIYRPPRFRPVSLLQKNIHQGLSLTSRIGLLGAAVSDHPGIRELCEAVLHEDIRISFSSLRADALSPELIATLRQSKVKTATIAPDAGSQRMRDVINKGITEDQILNASEMLVKSGIPNLKLYFMIGLPTETPDDVEAIVVLCKQIKHRFLKSSRIRKRIGEITVSLNCFVPKPFTPFQWVAMNDVQTLKKKIRKIKDGLKRVANVRVHADVPRWAYIQAMFSRGDRKVAQILALAHDNQGNWAKTLNTSPVNSDYYVLRERSLNECFPWEFIDHGIDKQFLMREYQRALEDQPSLPCPVQDCTLCGVCAK